MTAVAEPKHCVWCKDGGPCLYHDQARHDTDGQVHLAYFRNDVNTGFVWDGNIEHQIQVTREMGEPIIDIFDLPDIGGYTVSPMTLFALFKNACDDYVARQPWTPPDWRNDPSVHPGHPTP